MAVPRMSPIPSHWQGPGERECEEHSDQDAGRGYNRPCSVSQRAFDRFSLYRPEQLELIIGQISLGVSDSVPHRSGPDALHTEGRGFELLIAHQTHP